MSDDEIRELKKAFGLTDMDDISETKKDHEIPSVLSQILSYMQKQDAFTAKLTQELADLKAKHSSGKGDESLRVAMKSLTDSVDGIKDTLANLHKIAPAAAQPKGFTKAVDTGAPAGPKLTLADVTALSLKGEISAAEAARLTRMINHNLTPA